MKASHFFPWVRSFFTNKLVKTGEGFTSSDQSLSEPINRDQKDPSGGCSSCVTKSDIEFTFVGLSKVDGKVKYRLYHDKERRMFDVDEKLFSLIFRFSRKPVHVRSTR